VQTFIIRATCPLKLLRTRGSDRRAELRLSRGSGQPLSTARRPTGKSPARELRIGHSQGLGLPASALTMIIVSESDATSTHGPIHTGALPQFSGTQRHSQVRERTANPRLHRSAHFRFIHYLKNRYLARSRMLRDGGHESCCGGAG
jgi:hypothetical protein